MTRPHAESAADKRAPSSDAAAPSWPHKLLTHLKARAPSVAVKVIPATDRIKKLLSSIQSLMIGSAAGSARASMRMASLTMQIKQFDSSLAGLLQTAQGVHADIRSVSVSAAHSLEAAKEMHRFAEEGRSLSVQNAAASAELQTQMHETVQRIESLVSSTGAILNVSEVIANIARQIKLLSFNAAIEAAHAGEAGRGFSVVASEVRNLADHTAAQTREIRTLLDTIAVELEPTRKALSTSQRLVEDTTRGTRDVGQALGQVAELASATAKHMGEISGAVVKGEKSMDQVFADLKIASASSQAISEDAESVTEATFGASKLAETSFQYLVRVDTRTPFHRAVAAAYALRDGAERIFERAVDQGRCALRDVLAHEYREICGAEIQGLRRLFDVSRVPATGFDPPKFTTGYDAAVDQELQTLCDAIKATDSAILYAMVVDLNLYGPSHHSECCKDWTGDRDKDLAGNRLKRFYADRWLSVSGTRNGLGPNALQPGPRASREDFLRAGCILDEVPATRKAFTVQIYGRDTGAVMMPVFVPLFVKGQRYGSVNVAWAIDGI